MNTKNLFIGTALLAALCLTAVTGYALANPRQPADPIAPYDDNGFIPKGHEWARDIAVKYLEINVPDDWVGQDVTNPELLGASIVEYTSGELKVTVSHCLNPTADYSVVVEWGGETYSLWVSQTGSVRT